MARPIRVEYADAVYHVTARGNERKVIFNDDADRRGLIDAVAEATERFGIVVHAWCWMPNHYHLLIQTPRANLSAGIGWLQTAYTIRFNRRHNRSGHLFQGRFKAHVVEADAYGRELIKYIHLNPVRPTNKRKSIPPDRKRYLSSYRWSSHRVYAGLVQPKAVPTWLCTDWMSYFGRTRRAAVGSYRREIAAMFARPVSSPWDELRGGLVLGDERLWSKVTRLIEKSDADEELRWRKRARRQTVARRIRDLVARESDRRVQMWLLVRQGGQRMTDVARAYGYRDGSGVHQALRRLEGKAQKNAALARHLSALKTKCQV
ncbi:MAG: transposase [Phycisphaerae bacterium]|nr:transposase [Phycisphaerae bacterium]